MTIVKFYLALLILAFSLMLGACSAAGPDAPLATSVPITGPEVEASQAEPPARSPTPIPFPSPTPTRTPVPKSTAAALTGPGPAVGPTPPGLVSTPTGAPAPRLEVVTTALYLRQGPGLDFAVKGGARRGDQFVVTGIDRSGYWLQIVTPQGDSLWISANRNYIRLLGAELGQVPRLGQGQAGDEPTPAASPTRPGPAVGERLLIANRYGGELYFINLDGTNLRHLASGVIDPIISPDSQQVAFTRWDSAEMGTLYALNLDGSGERVIMEALRQARSPAWSADGQKIIFSFQPGGSRASSETCRSFAAAEAVRLPPNIVISQTTFNSGGLTICFIPHEYSGQALAQLEVASGQFEILTEAAVSPGSVWDPFNPRRVIYAGERGLVELDIIQNSSRPVSGEPGDTNPVFSPDGYRLALMNKHGTDSWQLHLLDLRSGFRQALTGPAGPVERPYHSVAPAWSPDGSRLAFLTDRTGRWEIWAMPADGSDPRPLFGPEVQAQLNLAYSDRHERLLNWLP